jgi:hypothetical protein
MTQCTTVQFLYVADPDEVVKTGRAGGRVDLSTGLVEYTKLTLAEYNERYQRNWSAIEEAEIVKLVDRYLENMQGPWVEIDEERYDDMLDVMPPFRLTQESGIQFFFMSEGYSWSLFLAFIHDQKTNKYYEAMRDARKPVAEIIAEYKVSVVKVSK